MSVWGLELREGWVAAGKGISGLAEIAVTLAGEGNTEGRVGRGKSRVWVWAKRGFGCAWGWRDDMMCGVRIAYAISCSKSGKLA